MTNPDRVGLTGDEIDEQTAMNIAREFIGNDRIQEISSNGQSQNGNIECYSFNAKVGESEEYYISVSIKGGHVVSMNSNRDVTEENISSEEAVKLGKEFLEQREFKNMGETYYLKMDGILTVNYAYKQNGITMYPDLIKVKIALDNGEILGMASRPDYDPNNYQDYTQEVLSRNLPIWASYEPGSTFKIITTSAAVEEGVVDLNKDHFYDSGSVNVDGSTLRCWKAGGHGEQTFLQVLQNSCNPGFVKMGQLLGKERLFDYIDKFGFGTKTGVDLNGEGKGIIFDLDQVGNVELATTAFGQGVSVTPIHLVV